MLYILHCFTQHLYTAHHCSSPCVRFYFGKSLQTHVFSTLHANIHRVTGFPLTSIAIHYMGRTKRIRIRITSSSARITHTPPQSVTALMRFVEGPAVKMKINTTAGTSAHSHSRADSLALAWGGQAQTGSVGLGGAGH